MSLPLTTRMINVRGYLPPLPSPPLPPPWWRECVKKTVAHTQVLFAQQAQFSYQLGPIRQKFNSIFQK